MVSMKPQPIMWRKGNLPFLELNLGPICARLSSDQLLEVPNSIIWTTLHADYGLKDRE